LNGPEACREDNTIDFGVSCCVLRVRPVNSNTPAVVVGIVSWVADIGASFGASGIEVSEIGSKETDAGGDGVSVGLAKTA
jgi:hypothetical protein